MPLSKGYQRNGLVSARNPRRRRQEYFFLQSQGPARLTRGSGHVFAGIPCSVGELLGGRSLQDAETFDPEAGAAPYEARVLGSWAHPLSAVSRLPVFALGGSSLRQGQPPPRSGVCGGRPGARRPAPYHPSLLAAIETGLPAPGPRLRPDRPEPPPPGQPPAPDWSFGKRCGAPGSPAADPRQGPTGGVCHCRSGRPPLTARGAPGAPGAATPSRRPRPRPLQRQPSSRAGAGPAGKVREGRGARRQHPHPARASLRRAADPGAGKALLPSPPPQGKGDTLREEEGSSWGQEKVRRSWGRPLPGG